MANLYTGSGAESNRSDKLLLLAKMTVGEGTTNVTVKIDYTINKTTSTNFTDAGTRYGILVKNAVVNSSGQLTSAGIKIASAKITTPPDGDSSGSVSFTFKKGNSATTYSGVTFLISDQDAVTRSSDTTYLWTGQKGGSVSALPSRFAVSSFTVPVGYTQCLPPKDGFTDHTTKKRNEEFTMKWNAGTAGNNLTISGYRVYMRYNDIPTLSSYDKIYDVTDTSKTWTLKSDIGTKYYFKVQTLCKKSEDGPDLSKYDSALSKEYTTVEIVNTAPTLSKVELDYTTLPYNGGSVKATFSVSDSNNQTIKYQYRIYDDNENTWGGWSSLSSINPQTISLSGIDQSISTDKTYTLQFRANDGVDNSNIQSETVTVLAAPNLTVSVVPGISYACANGNYYKTYTISASYQRSNSGTYSYYLMTDTTQTLLGTSSESTYTCDITKYNDYEDKTIYFGVSFKESLSYGNNSSVLTQNTNTYYIPAYYTQVNIFNKTENESVLNSKYFYDYLWFCLYNNDSSKYYDAGATAEVYYSTDGSTWDAFETSQYSNNANTSSSNYIKVNVSSLKENTAYKFKIILRRGIGTYHDFSSEYITKIITKIDFPTLKFHNTNSTTGNNIYPHKWKYDENREEFIDSGADVPFCGNQPITFSKSDLSDSQSYKNYGLNDLNDVKLKTKRTDYDTEYILGAFKVSSDYNGYYEYILEGTYYNSKVEKENQTNYYGITTYVDMYTIKFWIEATTQFGTILKSKELTLYLDFRTPLNITKASFYLDNIQEEEKEISNYLYEGEKIKVKIDYESFTGQDNYSYIPTLSLPGASYSEKKETLSFTPKETQEETVGLGIPIKVRNYVLGTFSPLPEFRESINTEIQLKIESPKLTTDTIFNSGNTYTTIKHISSNNEIIIDKGEYTDDNSVGYITLSKVKTGDLGVYIRGLAATDLDGDDSGNNKIMSIETEIQYSTDINFSTDSVIKTITLESYSKYGSFQNIEISNMKFSPTSLDDWTADYYYMRLKTTTTNPISGIKKECYSNIIVVYNISPTISYRKNHLGINYNFPTNEPESVSNAILVIGQASGRNEIIFNGSDYGKLIGFSASGGTWDSTTS